MAAIRIQKRVVRPTSLRNTRRTTNNNLRRRSALGRQRPLYVYRQTVRRRRHKTSSRSEPFAVNMAGIKPGVEKMIWQPSLFDNITDPLAEDDTPLAGYTDIELAELVASWRPTGD